MDIEMLLKKLQDEVEYKAKCDTGEMIGIDDWGEEYVAEYYPTKWQSEIEELIAQSSNDPEKLQAILEQFTQGIESGSAQEFVSAQFVSELSRNIRRITLENAVMRDDIVEYVSNLPKKEIQRIFGKEIAQMKGFDQKNVHHCYDLLGHTLHTVEGISREGLSDDDFKKLRIAALFHDVGKPDVAQFNEKTGQQVFYGHAGRSMEIAGDILQELGYSQADIEEMQFYIGHHDDFISYKSQLAPWMKQHEFIRGITPETVAEKMLENEYDFESMGYSKDQIRYICYALAHNRSPEFQMQGKPVQIDVDMDEVHRKIQMASRYKDMPKHSLAQYEKLLMLCRADANAQSEVVMQNGKKVGSRAEKIENMNNIDSSSERAIEILESTLMSSRILGQVVEQSQEETFQEFYEDMYYEGYRSPISDLSFYKKFEDKSPEFIAEIRAKILQYAPKQYGNIPEEYDLSSTNYDEEIFGEIFDRHLAEAVVDLDDISSAKTQRETPLEQREGKLNALEREARIMTEIEKLIAQREGEHSIGNE